MWQLDRNNSPLSIVAKLSFRFTLVPLKLYFKHGLCKVELGLAKGKRLYDKRHAIKEKEARRELRQRMA